VVPSAGRSVTAPTPSAPAEATTVSVTIDRPVAGVYGFVSDPGNLPRWSFFQSAIETEDGWRVRTSGGEAILRMAPPNDLGVLDHHIQTPAGGRIHIPMRVVENGRGSEVVFTVYRAPGMTDEAYAADVRQVEEDLATLKRLLES
jgi:uncharacterized protein YndB with AHSA1/START domain